MGEECSRSIDGIGNSHKARGDVVKVSLNKEDVWADLKYALDELDRPPLDMRSYLVDGAGLHEQSENEAIDGLLEFALFSGSYSKARMRAETKIAHEAIEKGLKAIL